MKKEIKCPNCGTPIQIDESTYDSIIKQLKDEFYSEPARQKKYQSLQNVTP